MYYRNFSIHTLGIFFLLATTIVKSQVPIIKGITPKNTNAGELISVIGENFETNSNVIFGSVLGNVISVNNQLIEVEVPSGSIFNNVSVLNPSSGFTGYSNERFTLSYGGRNGISNIDFDTQIDLYSGNGLYDLCLCDLDGDLLNDIAAANAEDIKISIFKNSSTPGNISAVKTQISLNATTLNVTCGDINGDGKPELVYSEGNNGNRIFILENNSTPGTLSFSVKTIVINSINSKRIAIRDLDLNGFPELIITDQAQNQVAILKNTTNNGVLSFDQNITILVVANAGSTAGLEVEDLNGDRRPEIIVNQFLTDGGGFYVATNNSTTGTIAFSDFQQFQTTGTFVNLKVGDLNGDNKPDIAATKFLSNTVSIFINNTTKGSSTFDFSAPNSFNTDQDPWGIDFADLDGDSKKDIIVATVGSNLSISILHNNSTPGNLDFPKVNVPVSFINRNITSGDIDGDGKPDIVFASVDDLSMGIPASNISILRNNKCVVPIISPNGPLSICVGTPQQLKTQYVLGATYEWKQNGVIVKSNSEHFIDITASGNYTVTVLMESSCSETSQTVGISVMSAGSLPSPTISTNSPVCIGGTLDLSVSNVGASQYMWRGPEGFNVTGITASLNNFTFTNSGRYFVDIYSGSCIIETKSVVVDAISSPDFIIAQSGSGRYCVGDPISLSLSNTNSNFSYQWHDSNGSISNETSNVLTPTSSGNYHIQATDLSNPSCPSINSNTLNVQLVELPQVDFTLPSSSCQNSSINFTNTSVIDINVTPQYNWTFGDGSTSTLENPSHIYTSANSYDVTLSVSYTGLSCTNQLTKQITINADIPVDILTDKDTICTGDTLNLSINGNYNSYDWSTLETNASITITKGGLYSVIVTDDLGCQGIDQVNIIEVPSPDVSIYANEISVSSNEEVYLEASGLVNYNWSPGSVLNDSTIYNPTALVSSTTLFHVDGVDENGCNGEASIEVIVILEDAKEILKPKNFFSPNDSDNINSFWKIDRIEDFPQCTVSVYDQTGNLIFEAQPYLNDWDGTKNGNKLNSGVYYFVIKCNNNKISKSGSITLLR